MLCCEKCTARGVVGLAIWRADTPNFEAREEEEEEEEGATHVNYPAINRGACPYPFGTPHVRLFDTGAEP